MSPRKNRPSDRTSQDSVKNIFERYEISKDDKHMIDCAVKSYMAGRARVTREPGKERTYSTDELQRLYPEYYTKFSKRWFELARCVIVIGEDKVLKFQNRVGKT